MISKKEIKRIARERIDILFQQAEEIFEVDSDLSDRYVEIARNIGMKHNVSIPEEFRRRICRDCNSFLVPGYNCRVRLDSKQNNKVVTCQKCGNVKRYPY